MPFRKTAFYLLCSSCVVSTGAALAGHDPPLPVPRPEAAKLPAADESKITTPWNEMKNQAQALDVPGRRAYQALIKQEAVKNGLPPDIADAVAAIESGYDPSAIGGVGEVGLMQVRPETAAMLGFKGSLDDLAKPDINIHYGVTYLGQAWQLANGDLCRALMKYRAGHGEETMSALSATYCGRARAHLASVGSPFAAAISVPFVFDGPRMRAQAPRRGPRIRTEAVSRAFWAAEEARVKTITQRLEAKWRRMAAR